MPDHAEETRFPGFDSDVDARLHWQRVEREAITICEPLARILGHKNLCSALDKSPGQITRELSPHYENSLSLTLALAIGRTSQDERLKRIVVVEGLGALMPEWQHRRVTPQEQLRALEAECREAGAAGELLIERATRRARGGQ